MAWKRNEQSEMTENDLAGAIGGFGRATGGGSQTFIGPIYSPDGTERYIVVDNAGAVSSTTSKPS